MSGPQWGMSILDYRAHLLLPNGDHPPGVLKARCGHYLLTVATRLDEPSLPVRCPDCQAISTARVGTAMPP